RLLPARRERKKIGCDAARIRAINSRRQRICRLVRRLRSAVRRHPENSGRHRQPGDERVEEIATSTMKERLHQLQMQPLVAVDHFFLHVSSSSFVHLPFISTSAMCSSSVALTLVKKSRAFMVIPPARMSPSNVSLFPFQPAELWLIWVPMLSNEPEMIFLVCSSQPQ